MLLIRTACAEVVVIENCPSGGMLCRGCRRRRRRGGGGRRRRLLKGLQLPTGVVGHYGGTNPKGKANTTLGELPGALSILQLANAHDDECC